MTSAPRGAYFVWQTWPEARQQRVSAWYDELRALQSLVELRLGLRHSRGCVFSVLLFNAWDTEGPWIPPGRHEHAGEYMEAQLRGVTGPAQGDLLASLSVPTSQAAPEERDLALDIRSLLAADARWLLSL